MPVVLNLDNSLANQVQDFQLEGDSFFIHTYWNPRSGWYVSVSDKLSEPVISGLLMIPNGNLTWRYSRDRLFPGDLWVIDNSPTETAVPLDRDNLGDGKRYSLDYFTQDEMNTLGINPRN